MRTWALAGCIAATWLFVGEPAVRKLNAAAVATINTPAVQQRLAAIAATVVAPERRSPEYLQKFVVSEIEKWAGPIKASGALIE